MLSTFRRILRLATLVAVATTVVAPGALPKIAHAEDTVSWALAPAGSSDGSRASDRPDLSYASAQGAVVTDAVTLYNLGTVQMTFSVYATDAVNSDSGEFELLGGGEQPSGVGSWVSLAQELITVPAGMQATIPIEIAVPANAPPGDYAGGIVASVSTAGSGEQGQAITVERRTGTRLFVRVKGEYLPALAVSGVTTDHHGSLDPLGGRATVEFSLENRGNMRLGGRPVVSVSGPFGIGRRTITMPELSEMLPGETIRLSVELDNVPSLLKLNTEVRIVPIGIGGEADLREVVGRDSSFAPPTSVLALLFVLIVLVLVVRARRRHAAGAGRAARRFIDATVREVERV